MIGLIHLCSSVWPSFHAILIASYANSFSFLLFFSSFLFFFLFFFFEGPPPLIKRAGSKSLVRPHTVERSALAHAASDHDPSNSSNEYDSDTGTYDVLRCTSLKPLYGDVIVS